MLGDRDDSSQGIFNGLRNHGSGWKRDRRRGFQTKGSLHPLYRFSAPLATLDYNIHLYLLHFPGFSSTANLSGLTEARVHDSERDDEDRYSTPLMCGAASPTAPSRNGPTLALVSGHVVYPAAVRVKLFRWVHLLSAPTGNSAHLFRQDTAALPKHRGTTSLATLM